MLKGYLCVHLDKQCHGELEKLAKHSKKHCHHVMLQFFIDQTEEIKQLEGRFVTMVARWLYRDDKADCVTVQLDEDTMPLLASNQYSHITLSCARIDNPDKEEYIKPSYSNTLIREAREGENIGDIHLSGSVMFVAFDPQPQEFNKLQKEKQEQEYRMAASREKPVTKEEPTCCGGIPLYKGKCPVCGDN